MEEQKMLIWLEKSKKSDKVELETDKKKIIDEIKKIKKEEILPKKIKITLWQRIKKVLNF